MNKWLLLVSKIYRFFYPLDSTSMYKRMGVDIGDNCKIMNEVMIDYSHYWLIRIGNNVTIAPRVHILAHDASCKLELNYTKLGLVEIQDNVFIGAGSIILPGVIIGENSIIGAGSIVTKDIPENCVAVGNPAKVVSSVDTYMQKQRLLMTSENCFDENYTLRRNITTKQKQKMVNTINKDTVAFVE